MDRTMIAHTEPAEVTLGSAVLAEMQSFPHGINAMTSYHRS